MKELQTALLAVQDELNAPKGQRNNFGNYNYRSCEDILAAAKPLLVKNGIVLTISDSIKMIGERFYVMATAVIEFGDVSISVNGYARETEEKKGMDGAQVTGAASSYARKYALNGLFCIDDTKDADATETHGKKATKAPAKKRTVKMGEAKTAESKLKPVAKVETPVVEKKLEAPEKKIEIPLVPFVEVDLAAGDQTLLLEAAIEGITGAFAEFNVTLKQVENYILTPSAEWTNNVKDTVLLPAYNKLAGGDKELLKDLSVQDK